MTALVLAIRLLRRGGHWTGHRVRLHESVEVFPGNPPGWTTRIRHRGRCSQVALADCTTNSLCGQAYYVGSLTDRQPIARDLGRGVADNQLGKQIIRLRLIRGNPCQKCDQCGYRGYFRCGYRLIKPRQRFIHDILVRQFPQSAQVFCFFSRLSVWFAHL